MNRLLGQITTLLVLVAPATARADDGASAARGDGPSVRYVQGVPTLDIERDGGVVMITPLPADHGRLAFAVAAFNHGQVPVNFGIENVEATIGGVSVPLLSRDALVAKAQHRAFWAKVGTVAATAVGAGLASGLHNDYRYRAAGITQQGSVFFASGVVRDNTPGVIASAAVTGAGIAGLVAIRDRLDRTVAQLNQEVLQTTTVDPENSWGGRIVLDKPRTAPADGEVRLTVRWNGAAYPFTFRPGTAGRSLVPVGATTLAPARPALMPAIATAPAPVMPTTVAYVATVPPAVRPQRPAASGPQVATVAAMSDAERYRAALRAARPL